MRQVRQNLDSRVGRLPKYFPFALSDRRPLRAAQGYLVKFPKDLVPLFPALHELEILTDQKLDGSLIESRRRARIANVARQSDIEVRQAIERWAVEMTIEVLRKRGYEVTDVGSHKSWNVEARRGDEELHVEVKGSAGTRESVELTDNELRHAEYYDTTMLVVVDQIAWRRNQGRVVAEGGRWREWGRWTPARNALLPTRYRYVLPDDQARH